MEIKEIYELLDNFILDPARRPKIVKFIQANPEVAVTLREFLVIAHIVFRTYETILDFSQLWKNRLLVKVETSDDDISAKVEIIYDRFEMRLSEKQQSLFNFIAVSKKNLS